MTVAEWLLDAFLYFANMFPTIETPHEHIRRLSGCPQKFSREFPQGIPKEFPGYRVRQEIKRMKERGWVTEAEEQGKKFLMLTKKGRIAAMCRKLSSLSKPSGKQWDGKWIMVVFDIPEKGRGERAIIRGVLKSIGFYQLQKSVYIYPHETPLELIAYLKDKQLLHFVRFARIEQMDNISDIKKHFGL